MHIEHGRKAHVDADAGQLQRHCPADAVGDLRVPGPADGRRRRELRERRPQPHHPPAFVIDRHQRPRRQRMQLRRQRGNLRRRADVAAKQDDGAGVQLVEHLPRRRFQGRTGNADE